MTPLGWGWAPFVWGYALAWFLVNDRVKLLAYRILDPPRADQEPALNSKASPEVMSPLAKPTHALERERGRCGYAKQLSAVLAKK